MSATQFKHDCPYCSTKMAGFEFVHSRQHRLGIQTCSGTAVCGVCNESIIVIYNDGTIASKGRPASLAEQMASFPGNSFAVKKVIPEGLKNVPDRLPVNVKSFFVQGIANEKNGNWDASGAMFRKSIDVGTKALDPTTSTQNLFKRINSLTESGRLTADIAVWAHEVRIDGNDSVHSDIPETKEDVAAIHEFARAVLLYLFTLPALVAERATLKGGSATD